MSSRFDPFFNLSQDFLAITDAETGRILHANATWERVLGWAGKEIEGKELLELCHPGDRERLSVYHRETAGKGDPREIELRLLRRQGGYRWAGYKAHGRSGDRARYVIARDISDEREKSESWEAQRELFDAIVENLPVAVFLKDAADGFRFRLWNKSAEKMFQLPRREILGKTVDDFWPKEQADFFRAIDEQVIREDRLVEVEEEANSIPGGSTILLRTRKLPLRLGGSQKALYLLCISDDITREKSLRNEVLRSETLFKSLFQNSPVSMTVHNHERRYVQANRAFQVLTGYTEEELQQKTIFDLTHPDDIPKSQSSSAQLDDTTPVTIRVAKRGVTKPGEVIWVNVTTTPIPTMPGESPLFVSVLEDITELRRKEQEQLQMSEEAERQKDFLRTILDASPSPIFVRTIDGKYVMVNSAFERVVGVKREEVIGKAPHDFLSKELADEFDRDDSAILRSGRDRLEEQTIQLPGGEHYFLTQTFLLRDSQGVAYATGGIATDITELTLAQKRLVQASKMSSLGEMAGGIAHEINNPLAIIHGRVGLLKGRLDTGPIDLGTFRQELTQVEKTSERIARIIKGLRTFSRASESDPLVPTRISQIIEDTLELCRARFTHHQVDLKVVVESDPLLSCRATQISQVLMNLLGNSFDAVEALPQRWVEVKVRVAEDRAVISVTDSGSGIPPEIAAKLMQPFFTTKEAGKGIGLGLSISCGIVEGHRGRLYYDSGSPHTRFVVELPMVRE